MPAEVVDALVEGTHRPLDSEAAAGAAASGASSGRAERAKKRKMSTIVPSDESALEPEVRADVVGAEREQEPDRAEQHRAGAAEAALEQDDRGHVRRPARVPPRRLVDAHRVAADRRGEHLARGVRDEVRPRQPPEALLHPLRAHQPLPAKRHGQGRADHDRDGEREPPRVRVERACRRSRGCRSSRRGSRARAPSGGASAPIRTERFMRRSGACTRRTASTASRMSSSACAGESGSESTSSPARSATGSGG